jgi:hypothetical protein
MRKDIAMNITCLHTAQSHVAAFDTCFAREGWEGALNHIVRADLLARAQQDGADAVARDLRSILADHAADAILCTCSTLGPVLERFGDPRLVRIDRPAMEAAAAYPAVLLAICLESTRSASAALFADCAKGRVPRIIMCDGAWPLFEAGEMTGFYRRIAATVGQALIALPDTDCIVLGQASMQGAALLLADTGVPVLTTPDLAVRRAIMVARR